MHQAIRFDNVYVSPRVRVALHSVLDTQYARKFWDLVNRLRNGEFMTPGMRVERLRTTRGKVYSARLNVEMRIIFSMYTNKDTNERSLVIWDANHHDDAYDRVERTVVPAVFQPSNSFLEPEQVFSERDDNLNQMQDESPDSQDITNGLLLFRVPYYVLTQPSRYRAFERNIDRYLRLSEEQEELLGQTDSAYLVRGGAGTGKTSLALFYALHLYEHCPEDDVYFFTYHQELACVCRCYKTNLLEDESTGEDHPGEFHVFSFLEFCRHFLKRSVDATKINWQWIDRAQSVRYLNEIISARAKWARMFSAEDLYGYIYSLLKGRFVPGTDRLPGSTEDFKRIFKGYGMMPANIEDVLEIFGHYEERLNRLHQKDEADLIRYCFQNLKDRAVLSEAGKATWIIIDEIQDFTELEWKSILLFWENQLMANNSRASYPFICGDRNQNISRSGFRWQELDTYVENILKKSHRPNAINKVQLHRNFRNTKEIFDLGTFIHSFSPQAGADLGLPPELHGGKPRVVVGTEEEFSSFLSLLNDPYDESMPAPLVIVSEDPKAWMQASAKMISDDQLFFMPVHMSKGLEFEDLIIFRMFSSISQIDPNSQDETLARLIDLWYMVIMRARQNLLLFITQDELQRVRGLLGNRFHDFLNLVEMHTSEAQSELLRFYHQRERYLPNYAVVFLERTKATQLWEEFLTLEGVEGSSSEQASTLKDKALQLWKRCRDAASLGKAYMHLEEYNEAIKHLKQASLDIDVAICYEKLNKFDEAAETYLQAGQVLDAARCLEIAKRYGEAAEMFEQLEQWLQAATNYYLAGQNAKAAACFEKAGLWQSAADLYRGKSNWLKAAELYQKCGQFEVAGDMYLKVKDRLDAARCYIKAQQPEKAGPLLEGLMRWGEAAEAFEQAQDFVKAGVLYTKAGRPKDAARCKESSGDLASAASAYERIKNWDKAAKAYLELKDYAGLARCLDNLGKWGDAAEAYTQAGMINEAGHCFEKAERWMEAAERYLKADNKGAAASMLARVGRRLDAARLFLLVHQASVAVEVVSPGKTNSPDLRPDLIAWVEQINKPDISAQLHEALGNFELAAQQYRISMKLSKAAECAEKAGKTDLAAELFLQDGKYEQAANCFRKGKQINKAAHCYEMLKKWDEARALYEQLNDREGIQRCETAANWL
jgi:superfamily I DNA/RNA helicase/Txe/YoeB family toxin of Txe-Axe toxin-antitoxin module